MCSCKVGEARDWKHTCSCCLIRTHSGGPCPPGTPAGGCYGFVKALHLCWASRPCSSLHPSSRQADRVYFPKTCHHLLVAPLLHAPKDRGQQVPSPGQAGSTGAFRKRGNSSPTFSTHSDVQACTHRPALGGKGGFVRLSLKEQVNHHRRGPDPAWCFSGNCHVFMV